MRIRNKLLLASSIPILLLVIQIVVVNLAVRELQQAVQFIASAQATIEADIEASTLLQELRDKVKKVPSFFAASADSKVDIETPWNALKFKIRHTLETPAARSVDSESRAAIQTAFRRVETQIGLTIHEMANASADLDSLIERAILTNSALVQLDGSLDSLAISLRQQLQQALEREEEIHNLPVIAGTVIGSLAVFLSVILVWVFVDKGIARRLTELSASMLAIAGGNLGARIPKPESSDEIGEMSGALEIFRDTADEIEKNNIREIAQARQRRQYWLENMASFLRHELKNKQLGAEQSINLLMQKEGDNTQVRKYCERAKRSLTDMKELISSSVHAADIESALLSEEYVELDLDAFLKNYILYQAEQGIDDIAYINGLHYNCKLTGDRQRLEQMLDKIVSNAADFRESGTEIVIRASVQPDDHVKISIENTGPNLPENTQRLFDLSVTARDAEKNKQGNVGFGLFIARRIAEYHKGKIEALNSDSGAVFSVTLPMTQPAL